MIYAAGDCPVGCDGYMGRGVLLVTPRAGGRVHAYCPDCGCVWDHPNDAAAVDYIRGPRDIGTTDAGLRPATQAEIAAAGFAPFVVAEHDEATYSWPRRVSHYPRLRPLDRPVTGANDARPSRGGAPMINGGNATLYVEDMDAAVAFYTEKLGLPLRFRAGNHWAEVEAGKTLVIGLHPTGSHGRPPGVAGSVQIGLTVDPPLEDVMKTLEARGVRFDGPIVGDPKAGLRFANFKDMDGNALYLWEQADTHA